METKQDAHLADGIRSDAVQATSCLESVTIQPTGNFESQINRVISRVEQSQQPITVTEMQREFAAEVKAIAQQRIICPSHGQIMKKLLEGVSPVDFRKQVGFGDDNEDAKLKNRHYLIIVVEELLALAVKNKWGLCRRHTTFYTFNGAYWKAIDEDDLKAFLRKVAEKMGMEKFTARHVGFSNQLFDQFTETAYLPAPQANQNWVLINLSNGTFQIGTQHQTLRNANAADFLTHQLPFAHDPAAKAPLFEAFLQKVQPDEECQKLLAEFIGYVFVPSAKLKLEKALLLYGSGANGKSVVFEIIIALLGADNVTHYSLRNLTIYPAYCRAHLVDKLLNYASEISDKLEADTFKQLASGEPMEARLPHGQPFISRDYAKLMFNGNELPTDVEHTPALTMTKGATPEQAERVAAFVCDGTRSADMAGKIVTPPTQSGVHTLPEEVFRASLGHYEKNQFAHLLRGHLGVGVANDLLSRFLIGTSTYWPGASVFWYVDKQGRKRGGQIKLFDAAFHTAKYVDHTGQSRSKTSWVHTALTRRYRDQQVAIPHWLTAYNEYAERSPCLFGLPQLLTAPTDQPVAIVEAPKTAVLCTPYFPQFTWLAVGALSYLNAKRLAPLRDKSVVLFPDLSTDGRAFARWQGVADALRGQRFCIRVSDYLERRATDAQRAAGFDVADYLLGQWPGYPPDWDL